MAFPPPAQRYALVLPLFAFRCHQTVDILRPSVVSDYGLNPQAESTSTRVGRINRGLDSPRHFQREEAAPWIALALLRYNHDALQIDHRLIAGRGINNYQSEHATWLMGKFIATTLSC